MDEVERWPHPATVLPGSPYWILVGGDTNMSSGGRERTAYCLKAVRLPVAALTVMSLAACAQSSIVGSKDAALVTRQQASPGPYRTAASVTNDRRAAGSPNQLHGLASFYTEGSETASGEKLDGHKLTAAHRTLPFGTRVRVTNVTNGRSVTVRINDRGPFVPGRVVDVSYLAAETLGMTATGVAKVKLEVVP